MIIGIGIDTGGTYTDAVAYDYESQRVIAKGKALTTKENLEIGIGQAIDTLSIDTLSIDKLPEGLLKQTKLIALSTTLATNACVENKGGRAKLVLLGTTKKVLEWIGAEEKYGLKNDAILCVDTHGSFDGNVVDEPDWEELLEENGSWLRDADALSVAEVYAVRNGSVCEKKAKALFEERYDVPVVLASDLVNGLNVMERGATALLNARLLPVIQDFIRAVAAVLEERGVTAPTMIVRSDGSLMTDTLSRERPVETILSGPAASVLGGRALSRSANCLIVDMGGTTTDISMIKDNVPAMSGGGVCIGGWRTQVKGVFMDTFGLGGDSAIRLVKDNIEISTRRVQPLCVTSSKWPGIKKALARLLEGNNKHTRPLHEFLYLVREPKDLSRYSSTETSLCSALRCGPLSLEEAALASGTDLYNLKSERLESEGIVMRCGLTPTDIMHIKGDFSLYDREASVLAARYFLRVLPQYQDDEESFAAFADEVYDLVKHRLYENIVRVLLTDKYPGLLKNGQDEQLRFLISQSWAGRKQGLCPPFFDFGFRTEAVLVGIGAPTHVFLPDVAKALGTSCFIPEHAEVANAVGAVIADISAAAQVEISPIYTADGITGYTVHASDGNRIYDNLEEASQGALSAAAWAAACEARMRGAMGELSVSTQLTPRTSVSRDGMTVDLGTTATATATGRIGGTAV